MATPEYSRHAASYRPARRRPIRAIVGNLVCRAAVRPRRRVPLAAAGAGLALLSLLAVACGGRHPGVIVAPPRVPTAPGQPPAPDAGGRALVLPAAVKVRVAGRAGTRVLALSLDEYVLGVVRAELLPATLHGDPANPMLEVQAIVSRTYAVANLGRHAAEGFDVCDTTHCQVFRGPTSTEGPTDAAARAVLATRGHVIMYLGRAIQALFHADCGGHTASAASVWGGGDAPYLASVPDSFCSRRPQPEWTSASNAAALAAALDADDRTSVGARLDKVEVAGRDAFGRALLVSLAGTRKVTVRAEVFRGVVNQAFGQRSIRSTRFTVVRQGPRVVISGVGLGHGVGLCQAGAALRARTGQTTAGIIAHYFPGTLIQGASTASVAPKPVLALLAGTHGWVPDRSVER